jgi:acetyl-CoA acyltransferase
MAGASPFPEAMVSRYQGRLVPQGIAAELVASRWKISRDEQDDFGYRSHLRAGVATREGYFKQEIEPARAKRSDASDSSLDVDEGVRLDPDRERMRALPPAFQSPFYAELFPGEIDWSVTAGNSSQISDGAAAVLIADEETARELGLEWRARIVSFAVTANDPVLMLTATIPATQMALAHAGLELSQIEVVEISEAFASPVLAWKRDMGVSDDWFEEHVNPNGGAIALGHPLGASGTRLLTSLIFELQRRGGRYGLQVMCEGGGMANATIIETARS